jgi:preprotein translocase subunit SecY
MLETLNRKNSLKKKITLTLFILFIYRFGNTIPLSGIDQEALRKTLGQLDNRNSSILQVINMYSGGGGSTLLSPFSLGIIPYINASILIDLLTALVPSLEKLQNEEGEMGRKKLNFYKKIVSIILAIFQSFFLLSYLKPYIYNTNFFNQIILISELVTGSLLILWLTNVIDTKGIGNGTSVIIFANIVVTALSKNLFLLKNFTSKTFLELFVFQFLIFLICISQSSRLNIPIISARQLAYLENIKNNDVKQQPPNFFTSTNTGLTLKFNQAGIFPIIIASNLLPLISYGFESINIQSKILNNVLYYFLIIGFNYFYTLVFWDPQKISEQLRKASVVIINVTPGKETISCLENCVRITSIIGGIFLCFILIFYELMKNLLNPSFLNQINISSLIILVGVAYEIQKTLRFLSKK